MLQLYQFSDYRTAELANYSIRWCGWQNETLYINEVVSKKQQNISDILKMIPGDYHRIILQFCPDKFLSEKEYSAVLAGPECCIMVSDVMR